MATETDLARWARRGKTTERGLGADHQKIREDLIPTALGTRCPIGGPRCIGVMDDPALMELDHSTPRAKGGTVGDRIVCAPCNHSEGARMGNAMRTAPAEAQPTHHRPVDREPARVFQAKPLVSVGKVGQAGLDAWDQRRQRTRWRQDPVEWADSNGLEMWSGQHALMRTVAEHNRVAVRSAHSTGKTFSMAVLVAWWLNTHEPGTARCVTTAPSGDQVRGVLWVEINRIWEILGLPGRRNQSEVWFGSYQAAVGRKSSDYSPATFSGWHAEHLLVIVDEADGVSANLWNAVDTLATNEGAKIVGIGNPDDPQSEFRKRQSDQPFGGVYRTVKISAWDTPNFTGEPVSPLLHSVLLSPQWVAEKRVQWGGRDGQDPDHPFWQSKVEAEYPDESANAVIRLSDLARARRSERDGVLARADDRYPIRVGVDVAGSDTGDESVIRGRRGLRLLGEVKTRTGDPEELEDWLIENLDLFGAQQVAIDADGIGFGFAGAVRRRRGKRMAVTAIRSSASAGDPKTYLNRRAEMWWQLREALSRVGANQLDFTQMDDDTAAQLLMPRYQTNKGKIQIESKDDLRKRLGRSPDSADAVVYVFAEGAGSGQVRVGRARGQLLSRS